MEKLYTEFEKVDQIFGEFDMKGANAYENGFVEAKDGSWGSV